MVSLLKKKFKNSPVLKLIQSIFCLTKKHTKHIHARILHHSKRIHTATKAHILRIHSVVSTHTKHMHKAVTHFHHKHKHHFLTYAHIALLLICSTYFVATFSRADDLVTSDQSAIVIENEPQIIPDQQQEEVTNDE